LHFLLSRDIKIAALVINKSCFMGSRFACGDGRGFYVFANRTVLDYMKRLIFANTTWIKKFGIFPGFCTI